MPANIQLHSQWAQLSSELWGMVFEHLKITDSPDPRVASLISGLPLVCKKFVEVLEGQPQLRSHLKICRKLLAPDIADVAAWMYRHKGCIDQYTDHSSEWSQHLMVALLSHQVSLVTTSLRSKILPTDLIAGFPTLTHCTLFQQPGGHRTSLAALQALPALTALVLEEGIFDHVEAAAVRLTSLVLTDCTAICHGGCLCTSSLVEIALQDSELHQLHATGIVACSRLKSLSVFESTIYATQDSEHFQAECRMPCQMPESLTSLTVLSALRFTCNLACSAFSTSCLVGLTALQSLEIEAALVDGKCELQLLESMTALTLLSRLCIRSDALHYNSRDSRHALVIKSDVDWARLVSLKALHLGGELKFTDRSRLSSLATLGTLELVQIQTCYMLHRSISKQLVQLAHKLGSERPRVQLVVT